MNLIVGSPVWLLVLLTVAVLAAAIEDVVRLRISNVTCAIVLASALVAMGLHQFPTALWQNGVIFLLLLTLGTFAFGRGWMGGGDVKFLSSLGLWFGFHDALWFVASVFIVGGLVTIIYVSARYIMRREGLGRGDGKATRVPYGVAIAIGSIIVFGVQLQQASRPHLPPGIAKYAQARS